MCHDKSITLDRLTVKKSTYMDELRKAVPAPRSTEPPKNIDLPRWRRTPLDRRMPALHNLQKELVLARRKLGEPLRIVDAAAAYGNRNNNDDGNSKCFDMSDPYNREIYLPYEGLHDPHLARFFLDSPCVRDNLIKAGLLTEELYVKCNLKEYNDYRNYVRTMHSKAMKRELLKRDEMQKEKLVLEVARKQSLKEAEKFKKEEIRVKLLNDLRQQKEHKLQNLQNKWIRSGQVLRSLNRARCQTLSEKIAERRANREIFKRKRAAMAKREQQLVLNALKRRNERDSLLTRTLQQNKIKRRDAKTKRALQRYEQKKKEQEETIKREIRLMECIDEIKKKFLEGYEKKLALNQKKMQDIFIKKRQALEKSLRIKKKIEEPQISTCCCNS